MGSGKVTCDSSGVDALGISDRDHFGCVPLGSPVKKSGTVIIPQYQIDIIKQHTFP